MKNNYSGIFNKTVRIIAIIHFSFIAVLNVSGQDDFIPRLSEAVEQYNNYFPHEKVYLSSDKDIYKPGETIWFNAWVRNVVTNDVSELSKGLKIKLFDKSGQVIDEKKYKLEKGETTGSFALPGKIKDGFYALVAYSSWMENDKVNNVFRKFIEIRNSISDNYILSISTSTQYISPGNTFKAEVMVLSSDNKPLEKAKVKITAKADEKVVFKDNGRPNIDGKIVFDLVPDNSKLTAPITITCISEYNGEENSATKIVYLQPTKINLQFFPEGGVLLAGIPKQLVVKATDLLGNPLAIEGTISDQLNNQTFKLQTNQSGFGSVFVSVLSGSKLKASISTPAGITEEFRLPEASLEGTSLSLIKKTPDSLFVRIEKISEAKQSELYCLAYAAGKVVWAASATVRKVGMLKIPVKDVEPGILQILVFNKENKLLAERQTFIGKNLPLTIKATTDMPSYNPFSKTTVEVQVNDPGKNPLIAQASLAVSSLSTSDSYSEADIFYNNYFLNNSQFVSGLDTMSDILNNVDMQLIAYPVQTVDWDNIFFPGLKNKMYSPKDGISGYVVDDFDNPVPNANVYILDKATLKTFQTQADSIGYFEEKNIELTNKTSQFNIDAQNGVANASLYIRLKNKFDENLNQFARNSSFTNHTYYKMEYKLDSFFSKSYPADPKEIKRKERERERKEQAMDERRLYNSGKSVLEIVAEMKSYSIIQNKIIFPGGVNTVNTLTGARFVIDQVLYSDDINLVRTMPTANIERIRILTDVSETSRYSAFASGGIIEITTRKKNSEQSATSPNVYEVSGYELPQTFSVNPEDKKKSTSYFTKLEPVDSSGNIRFSFNNNQLTGNYICKISGFSSNGIPFIKTLRYTVK